MPAKDNDPNSNCLHPLAINLVRGAFICTVGFSSCVPQTNPGTEKLLDTIRSIEEQTGEQYEVLETVPVEFVRFLEEAHQAEIQGILSGAEIRANSPEELVTYVERVRKVYANSESLLSADPLDFENSGDGFYFFRSTGNEAHQVVTQVGILVVERGRVTHRDIWAEGSTGSAGAERREGPHLNIQHLDSPVMSTNDASSSSP